MKENKSRGLLCVNPHRSVVFCGVKAYAAQKPAAVIVSEA